MTKLTIEIPDDLALRRLQEDASLQAVVLKALEAYISQEEAQDLRKTSTWELCGGFEVREPEAKFTVHKTPEGESMTNYAEHVDEVIY